MDKFVDWEVARNRSEQTLDRRLVTIDVEKPTHNLRSPHRVDTLNVYFDELSETVLI
jgi:hypothetical protein